MRVCRIICCQVEIIFAFNNFENYIWNHMHERLQSYQPSKSCYIVHGASHLMGALQNHHFEIAWQLNTTQFILVTPVTWHFYKLNESLLTTNSLSTMASVTENSVVYVAFTPLGVNIRIGQCNKQKNTLIRKD